MQTGRCNDDRHVEELCLCRANSSGYLDPPRGAKWMVRGATKQLLSIKHHPLEGAGIFLHLWILSKHVSITGCRTLRRRVSLSSREKKWTNFCDSKRSVEPKTVIYIADVFFFLKLFVLNRGPKKKQMVCNEISKKKTSLSFGFLWDMNRYKREGRV